MNRIRHYYGIVGDAAGALITPLHDPRFTVQAATLVANAANQRAAEALASAFAERGVPTDLVSVGQSHRQSDLVTSLRTLAARHGAGEAVLNVSCASPLHAIPAAQAFADAGHAVFAIDPHTDFLVWTHAPEHGAYPVFNVADRVDLRGLLAAVGGEWLDAQLTLREAGTERLEAARQLLALARRRPAAITALNRLSGNVDADRLTRDVIDGPAVAQFQQLADFGLGQFVDIGGRRRFHFHENVDVAFAKGGWLEALVFHEVVALARECRIQDAACGLRFMLGGVPNEMDVAFVANNRPHFIECKLETPTNRATGQGIGVENLYKLDSLLHVGGLAPRGLLVCLAKPTEHETSRAISHDLRLCSLGGQDNLREVLRTWIMEGLST